MKIKVLMEDNYAGENLINEHGLSVYVETEKHKLLMDTGASSKTWFNAKELGVKLEDVDTVVISHGHYDHTGGLMKFYEYNKKAEIYMHKLAVKDYFHGERYIGINKDIEKLNNLHLLERDFRIDEELFIFTDITGRRNWPESNKRLSEMKNGKYIQDEFRHEQCLVIENGGKKILISGCAHNGILNILDRFREIYDNDPDMVISGFHMVKKKDYTEEEIETIENIAKELSRMNTVFYTGHCTGEKAYKIMENYMPNNLKKLCIGEFAQ